MDLLIGADPEFFLKKDGKFVSAYGLIEGTKKNPLKVKDGAVQVDGMALEFNINPAKTYDEFEFNINSVLGDLRKMIPAEYEFAFVPVADFDEEYIRNQPEEARMLGCEPDYNAYTGKPNNPPDAAKNFRTASGHIHLGWTEDEDIKNPEHIEACEMIVKQLDCLVGLKSVVFDPDVRRRELYGKAGAYRPKSYGVEYRVMSNFWLNDRNVRQDLFNDVQVCFKRLVEGGNFISNFGDALLQKIINTSNVKTAIDYSGYIINHSNTLLNYYDKWKKASAKEVKYNFDGIATSGTVGAAPRGRKAKVVQPNPVLDIEAGPIQINNNVAPNWLIVDDIGQWRPN